MLRGVLDVEPLFVPFEVFKKLKVMRHLLAGSFIFRIHDTGLFPIVKTLLGRKPIPEVADARQNCCGFDPLILVRLNHCDTTAAAVPHNAYFFRLRFRMVCCP